MFDQLNIFDSSKSFTTATNAIREMFAKYLKKKKIISAT